MANVLFGIMGLNDTLIKGIELPKVGEKVFLDGLNYEVINDIKHFPEGGKGIAAYKEVTIPFVRILLLQTV